MTDTVQNSGEFRKFDPDATAQTRLDKTASAPPAPSSGAGNPEPVVAPQAPRPFVVAPTIPDLTRDPTAAPESVETKVAVLLPLSGPNAPLGRALQNAAQLSLFELAAEDLVLMMYDTGGGADGAARAAEQAMRDGAAMIIGPLLAESVAAARDVVRRSVENSEINPEINPKINIVAFSNSSEVAGDGVFILGFTPRQQVLSILDHAAGEGLSRVVVLAPSDSYGRAVAAAASSRAGMLFQTVYYNPAAKDLSSPVKALARYDQRRAALRVHRKALEREGGPAALRKLRQLEQRDTLGDPPFDAVLLPDTGKNLRTLASLLSYFDVDAPAVQLLGLRDWDLIANLSSEPPLHGAWYSATSVEGRIGFERRYKAAFGAQPPRHATLAYDATALAVVLARTAKGAYPPFTRAALMSRSGFLGVDGVFRFQPSGVAERAFAIFEVTKTGTKVRRSAPTTFRRLTN
ncbi:MAG: penicillin-binding protein activator [Alphaproteobacteria bacterium]